MMDTLTDCGRHFSVSIHLLGFALGGLTVDDVVALSKTKHSETMLGKILKEDLRFWGFFF